MQRLYEFSSISAFEQSKARKARKDSTTSVSDTMSVHTNSDIVDVGIMSESDYTSDGVEIYDEARYKGKGKKTIQKEKDTDSDRTNG